MYIEKARALSASEIFCHQIGIGTTKLNPSPGGGSREGCA
jgi:hypothetical protein